MAESRQNEIQILNEKIHNYSAQTAETDRLREEVRPEFSSKIHRNLNLRI